MPERRLELRGVVSSVRPFDPNPRTGPPRGWHRFKVTVLPITDPPVSFSMRTWSEGAWPACPRLGDLYTITFAPAPSTQEDEGAR